MKQSISRSNAFKKFSEAEMKDKKMVDWSTIDNVRARVMRDARVCAEVPDQPKLRNVGGIVSEREESIE